MNLRPRRDSHQLSLSRRHAAGLIAAVAVIVGALAAVSSGGGAASVGVGTMSRAAPTATPTPPLDRGTDAVTAPATIRLESLRVGSGVRGAEIIRPSGMPGRLPGIVFLHGWGLVAHGDYRPWIRHLARAGNQVILPRYQFDEHSIPDRAFPNALAGIRAALRRSPVARGTLVVAGHSAGAALAADYAASAPALGLPRPLAVFSAYPGRRILGYPAGVPEVSPARIPAPTRILALAGAADQVVGVAPAQGLVHAAVHVPTRRKRYVLVSDPKVDDHYGPTRHGRRARAAFWKRLDALVRLARR